MQQGADSFGRHACLGPHLVKGRVCLTLVPRLVPHAIVSYRPRVAPPSCGLLHAGNLVFPYMLGLFCEIGAGCQVVLKPLLLLFSLFPQLQYFLLGMRCRVHMFGEGLHCAFVRGHLLL